MVKTNVYVDGFNLYYGALRHQPYRWLDLLAFSRKLLQPWNEINRIRYFTARVDATPTHPRCPEHQNAYLRALETIPNTTIHFGHFLRVPGSSRVQEKGSDVNLASYLLLDACDKDYEVALVISNDSDLAHAIELVQARFGLTVGVATPVLNTHPGGKQRYPSNKLMQVASFAVRINKKERKKLRESQFPDLLAQESNPIRKPPGW